VVRVVQKNMTLEVQTEHFTPHYLNFDLHFLLSQLIDRVAEANDTRLLQVENRCQDCEQTLGRFEQRLDMLQGTVKLPPSNVLAYCGEPCDCMGHVEKLQQDGANISARLSVLEQQLETLCQADTASNLNENLALTVDELQTRVDSMTADLKAASALPHKDTQDTPCHVVATLQQGELSCNNQNFRKSKVGSKYHMMKELLRELVTNKRAGYVDISIPRAIAVSILCTALAVIATVAILVQVQVTPKVETRMLQLRATDNHVFNCSSVTDVTDYGRNGLLIGRVPGVGDVYVRSRLPPTSLIRELQSLVCQSAVKQPNGTSYFTWAWGVRTGTYQRRVVCLLPNSTQSSAKVYAVSDLYDLAALTDMASHVAKHSWQNVPISRTSLPQVLSVDSIIHAENDRVDVVIVLADIHGAQGVSITNISYLCNDHLQQQVPDECNSTRGEEGGLCCVSSRSTCYSTVSQSWAFSRKPVRIIGPKGWCPNLTRTKSMHPHCDKYFDNANYTNLSSAIVRNLLRDDWFRNLVRGLCPYFKFSLGYHTKSLDMNIHADVVALTQGHIYQYACVQEIPATMFHRLSRAWPILSVIYSTFVGIVAKKLYALWTTASIRCATPK